MEKKGKINIKHKIVWNKRTFYARHYKIDPFLNPILVVKEFIELFLT